MPHGFDKDYWEQHWRQGRASGPGSMGGNPPNPYLAREISDLTPGTALDAGCGAGAEAIWLADHGWRVTAADISAEALARAAERAAASTASTANARHLAWVEADLSVWSPDERFDLVMTHYAHAAMPQLEFYRRIAGWVAPSGTLLIVGHLGTANPSGHDRGHDHAHDHGHGNGNQHDHGESHGDSADHQPPAEASATAATITAAITAHTDDGVGANGADGPLWEIVTADEQLRTMTGHGGHAVPLRDVVVRAVRRR